jgi:hypothetical protein
MITDKEYVDAGGSCCPSCKGKEIEGDAISVDGGIAWQEIKCLGCGASWNDLYTLTGYSDSGGRC